MQYMIMTCNVFIAIAKKLSQSFIQFHILPMLFPMHRSRDLHPIEMLLLLLLLLPPLEFLVDALLKNASLSHDHPPFFFWDTVYYTIKCVYKIVWN